MLTTTKTNIRKGYLYFGNCNPFLGGKGLITIKDPAHVSSSSPLNKSTFAPVQQNESSVIMHKVSVITGMHQSFSGIYLYMETSGSSPQGTKAIMRSPLFQVRKEQDFPHGQISPGNPALHFRTQSRTPPPPAPQKDLNMNLWILLLIEYFQIKYCVNYFLNNILIASIFVTSGSRTEARLGSRSFQKS